MSTLFLVGDPSITGATAATNKNSDFREVLSVLERPAFQGLIDRVLVVESLQALFVRIYRDRLHSLPNKWNYESTTSLIVYNSSYSGSQIAIEELNGILSDFFTVLNIVTLDIKMHRFDKPAHAIEAYIAELFDVMRLESEIHRNRVLEINHWMNHGKEGCFSRIYTMLDHIQHQPGVVKVKTSSDPNGETEILDFLPQREFGHAHMVPKIISDIQFEDIIFNGSKATHPDSSYYLDLFSKWEFTGLSLPPGELIQCLFCILRYLSQRANLNISDNRIYLFLMTMELSYHQINRFHNFRHATDVAQATWVILRLIGLQDYRVILLLFITAIGHDIGHPGTNNDLFNESYTGFTTSNMRDLNLDCSTSTGTSTGTSTNTNSNTMNILRKGAKQGRKERVNKLSALFDKCSVLENFHFLSLKKILLMQWSEILDLSHLVERELSLSTTDLIRTGVISTDMQLHFKYLDMMNSKKRGDELTLVELICVVLKAADISNVTKPLDVSAKWAYLISLEFKDCAALKEFYHLNREKLANNETCASFIDEDSNSVDGDKNRDRNDDMEFEEQMVHNLNVSEFSVDRLVNKEKSIPAGQVFFIDTFAMEFFKQLSVLFPQLEFLFKTLVSSRDFWVAKRDELARNKVKG